MTGTAKPTLPYTHRGRTAALVSATRDYVARRTVEGKTTREITRCLKRNLAREVFALLRHTGEQDQATAA